MHLAFFINPSKMNTSHIILYIHIYASYNHTHITQSYIWWLQSYINVTQSYICQSSYTLHNHTQSSEVRFFCSHSQPLGWLREYVNPYIPTQTPGVKVTRMIAHFMCGLMYVLMITLHSFTKLLKIVSKSAHRSFNRLEMLHSHVLAGHNHMHAVESYISWLQSYTCCPVIY